ncbi:hypothetical protein Tco_0238340 [Tanacetum coccineum]
MKRVNTFVDIDTELMEGSKVRAEAEIAQESSSKRAGTELEQESIKKQKLDEDKETAELQRLIEVVLDKEEVAIDAIPLVINPPSIVDYKIHKEGKKTYYQIIRADGTKHGSTRPTEGYERVLWDDLKTMFNPHVEDQVWRNQHDYRVLDWKMYDSCGVHSLRMKHMHIHMLVEKRYPFTPATITDMLNKKLQCEHFSKMGRIVGIKRLHDDLEVTAAKVCVTAAKLKPFIGKFHVGGVGHNVHIRPLIDEGVHVLKVPYATRQDLGFIPSGNVVLSSTYVGKILGADQLLVILCYRYQESGIGYWILSMTISGSGVLERYYVKDVKVGLRRWSEKFGVSLWHGSRVDGRSILYESVRIDDSEANNIISDLS